MLRPTYPIRTSRLVLRPFTRDDLEPVHEYSSNPDVVRYLYWEVAPDRDASARALAGKLGHSMLTEAGQSLILAIERDGDGTVLGEVVLKWLDRQHMQGELGFVLNPKHHGHGYATEAAAAVLALAFDGLGLHRVIGRCDARNTASARVMERLGMRREAHFVQNEKFKGEWGDEFIYAMLASEYHHPATA